jgi:hypothetical protein
MPCPLCGGVTDVRDTREARTAIRRRRWCRACGNRFTTYERHAEADIASPAIATVRRLRQEAAVLIAAAAELDAALALTGGVHTSKTLERRCRITAERTA